MGILPWFLFLTMAALFGITAWRMHVAERALRRAINLLDQQVNYLRGMGNLDARALRRAINLLDQQVNYLRGMGNLDARIEADRVLSLRNTLYEPHAVVNLIDGLVNQARRGDR